MIDSLCFQKPVIRVKFDNDKHPIFDLCSAIISSDLPSLKNNILKIFESKDYKDSLSQNMAKFVNENYGIPENNPKVILSKLLGEAS